MLQAPRGRVAPNGRATASTPVVLLRAGSAPAPAARPADVARGGAARATRVVAAAIVAAPLLRKKGGRRRRGRAAVVQCRARPFPKGEYDHVSAAEYFASRPFSVASRASEFLSEGVGFGSGLLWDRVTGKVDENAPQRAKELTELMVRLGPTFIKIGQALSIRGDLLPPAYLYALTELQDSVPPVPTEVADAIIESELKKPVGELFEEISEKPIASASLGQVYRAQLVDGPEVAVKVQRPGMEELIALDLFLLRVGAGPAKELLSLLGPFNQDLVGLIDAWGEGFVGELDYRLEAANAREFTESIGRTPLADAVCVPEVIDDCTASKVLTTAWVEGTRLERSTAEDVTTLCSVAMSTYLTMLLEINILHADPHPGNLLRTPDGRLCILDWGLVTRVNKEIQVTMIEHVANLVSREYEELPNELVHLGFVPEGKEKEIGESKVVEVLSDVYSQWTDGGGAQSIDITYFVNKLQELGGQYGSIFRVPPYFFYIARAFVVLEGIGLENNKSYSIVSECLPYVSKRLLSDRSPRIAAALERFVYGNQKDLPDRMLNLEKVENLTSGFANYRTASAGLLEAAAPDKEAAKLVDQLAELLVQDGGVDRATPTPLQGIVIDELSKVLGASARSALASTGLVPAASDTAQSGESRWSVLSPDEKDSQTLETASRIAEMARPRTEALLEEFRKLATEDQVRVATAVLARVWEYRDGVLTTGGRVAAKLVTQGLIRLGKDLMPQQQPKKLTGSSA